jgi:nucleoside 2-deoxyribosyltransferase
LRIVICSSIHFTNEIAEVAARLRKMGHTVDIPYFAQLILSGKMSLEDFKRFKDKKGDIELRRKTPEDLIKRYWRFIKKCDAILVLNLEKNGVKNYIGGNTLMEMGFAYVLGKGIFLYNKVPEMGYKDEILAMAPIIINGKLAKIKSV